MKSKTPVVLKDDLGGDFFVDDLAEDRVASGLGHLSLGNLISHCGRSLSFPSHEPWREEPGELAYRDCRLTPGQSASASGTWFLKSLEIFEHNCRRPWLPGWSQVEGPFTRVFSCLVGPQWSPERKQTRQVKDHWLQPPSPKGGQTPGLLHQDCL